MWWVRFFVLCCSFGFCVSFDDLVDALAAEVVLVGDLGE